MPKSQDLTLMPNLKKFMKVILHFEKKIDTNLKHIRSSVNVNITIKYIFSDN